MLLSPPSNSVPENEDILLPHIKTTLSSPNENLETRMTTLNVSGYAPALAPELRPHGENAPGHARGATDVDGAAFEAGTSHAIGSAAASISSNDPPSYIPLMPLPPHAGDKMGTLDKSPHAVSGRSTTTAYVERRMPSSSIPHLLSSFDSANPENNPHLVSTPPLKVSDDQMSPGMAMSSSPPSSTIPPEKTSLDPPHLANAPEVGTTVQIRRSSGTDPLPPPLPPSYREGRNKRPLYQPVLYSAINSLETYNAGSFENKVMMAKAQGTYGRCRAFPGVPKKKTAHLPSDKGGAESEENISGSGSASQVNSSPFAPPNMVSTEQDCALIDQVGVEQMVPITGQLSESFIRKSKSSSNLDDTDERKPPTSLMDPRSKRNGNTNRSVTIRDQTHTTSRRGRRREQKKVGVFRPSSDAYTPRMNRAIKYKPAEERASVEKMSSTMGTIQRPNFRDALRRVAIIIHQHIVKIESRFSTGIRGKDDLGLFKASMREHFNEDNFVTPRYKCSMVRVPMARPGVVYSMRKIQVVHTTPSADEIYEFAHQLFKKVQLSSECSIVCLIYVEKMMEVAKVPLVAETWRPIFMCGLLLASKVWQDLSSWNIEFASVYPQFSLNAINRLELSFLKFIKWDLYISSSLYAKYYFALRSLLEKSGFRDRYNQMVSRIGGIAAGEALKISKRSEAVKEEALLQLSRSM